MILLLEVFKTKLLQKIVLFTLILGSLGSLLAANSYKNKPLRVTASDITRKIAAEQLAGPCTKFHVINKIGRKVYVVPFAYIKRFTTNPWHWFKAPILELDVDQSGLVDIGKVPTADDLTTVFGCVRVCATREEAETATYELTPDLQKIDLDLLALLNGKAVALHSSRYGVEGERLSYEMIPSNWTVSLPPLDFSVFNAGKHAVHVAVFFYGKEQDADEFTPWRFAKSDVYKLEPEKGTLIKVETIKDPYDRGYLRGYLGVFNEDQAKKAENSTYELLTPQQKFPLGSLAALDNKQVVITPREYGVESVFDVTTRLAPTSGAAKPMAAV